MEWNDPEKNRKAHLIIRTLLSLSGSDGEVHQDELLYIATVGEHIGVDLEEIRSIATGHYNDSFEPPVSEEERMTLLYYLLMLMKVDSNISEKEKNMIYEVGFKLGFNELMIRDLIHVISINLKKKLSAGALIKEVKKYLN